MTDFAPVAGQPMPLAPDLALVLAPNPSPMTYLGTNTYLLGYDSLAVIDPGPDHNAHLNALERAIAGRPVTHIIVTHSHRDHSALAPQLSDLTAAPVWAYGTSTAGRSAVMQELATAGLAGGGEGVDHSFVPDHCLPDGATLTGDWGQLQALHTPGHIGNHLCLAWNDAVFTGDHVMGWASSLVSPPDGDLTAFMASCARLATYDSRVFYPGHGAPISDPAARLSWLISHRKMRTQQICAYLQANTGTVDEITAAIYHDLPAHLRVAAARNVFAHLIDLQTRGIVTASPALSMAARFAHVPGHAAENI